MIVTALRCYPLCDDSSAFKTALCASQNVRSTLWLHIRADPFAANELELTGASPVRP